AGKDGSGESVGIDERPAGDIGVDEACCLFWRRAATNQGKPDDLDEVSVMEMAFGNAHAERADAGAGLAFKLGDERRRERERAFGIAEESNVLHAASSSASALSLSGAGFDAPGVMFGLASSSPPS